MKQVQQDALSLFNNHLKFDKSKLTDSHCHILDDMYNQTQEELLDEWFDNGGGHIFLIGVDVQTSKSMVEQAQKNDKAHAIVGIHPEYANQITQKDIDEIEALAPYACAIGEIGLDFYYGKEYEKKQMQLFREQLKIASKYNKPVCIHTREATQKTIDELKNFPQVKGVVHCYGGSKEIAKELVKMGYLIGVGGIVTFKNNRQLVESILEVGIDNIVLETDSPYLSPEPFRGEVNKPHKVFFVAKKVADLLNLTVDEVLQKCEENTLKIYKIQN